MVSCNGAGITNALFMLPFSEVVVLNEPWYYNLRFHDLLIDAGILYYPIMNFDHENLPSTCVPSDIDINRVYPRRDECGYGIHYVKSFAVNPSLVSFTVFHAISAVNIKKYQQ